MSWSAVQGWRSHMPLWLIELEDKGALRTGAITVERIVVQIRRVIKPMLCWLVW